MSDGLENVSVEVEVAPSAEPVQVETLVVPQAEPSSEPIHSNEQVFTPSADVAPTAERYVEQQVAQENGFTNGNNTDGHVVSEAGRQAKAAAAEDKKSDLIEQLQQSEARRKEKDDNFGMSSHDLTKLLDFISNPELQEKLKARLVKGGMDEKRAKKAVAELDEFSQLKKKQDSGQALTDTEKLRIAELRKSEDLKAAVQQTQDMRNEMELKTNGASTKVTGQQVESASNSNMLSEIIKKQDALFSSSSPSGIKAQDELTGTYNVAAAANKNELKPAANIVAQNYAMSNKVAGVDNTGFTV